jgi:hypothetical protein
VDKNAAGNYLISARDACSVHKTNGTSGSIIWRLDGKRSSFSLGDGAKFCFQHHARFHPELKSADEGDDIEIISLYDNSAHGSEDGRTNELHTAPTSSGKIIRLNTTSWTAELVQGFYPPDGLRSKSQDSTQIFPNGNALVNWGSSGALTAYDVDGTALFHTYLDSDYLALGVQNYRGFLYNWTGLPNEEPDIVALENEEGTAVYVSWNGDTETLIWRFFDVAVNGTRKILGDVKRNAFETSLQVPNESVLRVAAEAVDSKGEVLRSTRVVKLELELEVLPAHWGRKAPAIVVQGEL